MGLFDKLFGSQTSGPSASPSPTPVSAELQASARLACRWAASYRDGRALSEPEHAISIFSFMRWLAMADLLRSSSMPEFELHLQASNTSGRAAALSTAEHISHRPRVVAAIRRAHPKFDPQQEREWGFLMADHLSWRESFTRGVVLGTRALAYSFCASLGYMAPGDAGFGKVVQNSSPSQIRAAAYAWNVAALGQDAANELIY